MGFFSVLGNIVSGKQPFEAPIEPNNNKEQQDQSQSPQATANGSKVILLAQVERVEVHNNGPQMRVTAVIQNDSQVMIELDKIRLLGGSRELDTQLRPGEEREFTVYDGSRPAQLKSTDDDAYLEFKGMDGDYFQAYHTVEFKKEADSTYSISRIRSTRQVKGI